MDSTGKTDNYFFEGMLVTVIVTIANPSGRSNLLFCKGYIEVTS